MPNPNRDTLISRIQKLRKMTEASGATEAEALTAMAMVDRLMAEHGLTETDLSLQADAQGMITDYMILWQTQVDEWRGLPTTIMWLYHTRAFYDHGAEDILEIGEMISCSYVKFFGYPIDVAASVATMSLCATAVNTESSGVKGRGQIKASFRLGMITRLKDRIAEMATERRATTPTGTGLVVLKDQLVTAEYAKAYPHMCNLGRSSTFTPNAAAYAAGQAAGSRVDLGARGRVAAPSQAKLGAR